MAYFTDLAKALLQKLPNNGYVIKQAVRRWRVTQEIIISHLDNRWQGVQLANPYTVYWLDPKCIEFHTHYLQTSDDWEDFVFNQQKFVRKMQGGDWDLAVHRVTEMRIVRAIEDRIHHGSAWQTTDYYQYAVKQIDNGRKVWNCNNRAEFDKHCAHIDELISAITREGYQARAAHKTDLARYGYGEILINIGRDGTYLFQDGRHRLAIALTLGITQVPVQVLVRHPIWVAAQKTPLNTLNRPK